MNVRVSLKLFVVALLTFVILLALLAVGITINSRENYREQALQSISESYAAPQSVVGPLIVRERLQEVTTTRLNEKGQPSIERSNQRADDAFFPSLLRVRGELASSERHHGLYSVPVYEWRAHMEADFPAIGTPPDGQEQDRKLRFAVSDIRGIVGLPTVVANGQHLVLHQGTAADATANSRSTLECKLPGAEEPVHVTIDLVLAGTQRLALSPIADLNQVSLQSSWPSPLFGGRFLPRTRTVTAQGFNADWEISSLASSAQRQTAAGLSGDVDLFDVTLIEPSDPYKLSDRATKYGVLFVLLTFGGFFVFEVMKQLPIHPVQYLLVGFELALFFLLLISLSEHISFGLSYLISSVASIGLLTFYLSSVLRSPARGSVCGGMLAVLYACIYGLLRSEDNALLLGSLMLFAVLAVVMVVTRRVDWYRSATAAETDPTSPESLRSEVP